MEILFITSVPYMANNLVPWDIVETNEEVTAHGTLGLVDQTGN